MLEFVSDVIKQVNLIVEIFLNLHVLALCIVNLTKTPKRALTEFGGYTSTRRFYRVIELFAGLITPLAKR